MQADRLSEIHPSTNQSVLPFVCSYILDLHEHVLCCYLTELAVSVFNGESGEYIKYLNLLNSTVQYYLPSTSVKW